MKVSQLQPFTDGRKTRALLENPSARTAYMREWRAKHPEYNAATIKRWRRQRRELVIDHYGGKCVCCGETQFEFLALDHINGGGTKHKKEIGAGLLIEWILNNDFPKDIQVLCHNCNQAKGFYGICPHEKVE